MGKHRYSRYRWYLAKKVAKEVGFWCLVGLSVAWIYLYVAWRP